MKMYYLVILRSGTSTDQDFINASFRGGYYRKAGKVGEFDCGLAKNEHMYRGIFIFQNIKEELIEILSEDAAIKNNLLVYDILIGTVLPHYLNIYLFLKKYGN